MNKLIATCCGAVFAGLVLFARIAAGEHPDQSEPIATAIIPEPATLLLFGAGLGIVGFALMRRRRR